MVLVGEAKDGHEAIAAFERLRPDVTLMDLQMPQLNGIDALAQIRMNFPSAKIIVLTTHAGDAQATRALKAGAAGYLLKDSLRRELIDTIRTVHAGRKAIPVGIARELAEHLNSETLSERELDVLRSAAAGRSNKMIADSLGLTEQTVKSYMKNVFAKLGASDRTHAVVIAMKRGYLDS